VNNQVQPKAVSRVAVSDPDPANLRIEALPVRVPSLTELLVELAPFPPATVLLGACDDRLPVLLNLTEPEPGAVLLVGDPGSGKTRLLNVLINSACAINPPRKLRLCCLSGTEEFDHLSVYPHSYIQAGLGKREVEAMIDLFVQTVETRLYRGGSTSALLLIIDDLAELSRKLDAEHTNRLTWLLQNAARVQVWIFAALDPRRSEQVRPSVLDSFSTWLLGRSDPSTAGPNLPADILQASRGLLAGSQFAAYFDQQWVPFWIPTT
jgi:DNA segregation ATPase FtsK/SpoIIIE-like protein